ncbi:ZNF311 isoform 5 [Pan troglodytes]|uniref:ZNF311 isoform 5 n=1 Tax=Pan troglodytes TaxID=9598 RepID=A0A2J8NWU4_PANTR|nr:ZNF311 isoform 5 [Pan troglodytes]
MQEVRRGGSVIHHKEEEGEVSPRKKESSVVLLDESSGPPSQLLWTCQDTQLPQESALLPAPYPAFTKDGSQGNLPQADITLMSQAQVS